MIPLRVVEAYLWLSIRLSVISYFIHKVTKIKLYHAFLCIIAWVYWNTIGRTVFAMYIVHRIILHIQREKAFAAQGFVNGSLVGSNEGSIDEDAVNDKRDSILLNNQTQIMTKDKQLQSNKSTSKTKSTKNKQPTKKMKGLMKDDTSAIMENKPQRNPPLKSSESHPGLDGFHQWYSAKTEIYRIYAIPKKGEEIPRPLLSRSENGRVSVEIYVINKMMDDIDVYWIDYKGNEVPRGAITIHSPRWVVKTWVGHPWTFRRHRDQQLLLHFVPLRLLPMTNHEVVSAEMKGCNTSIGYYEFMIDNPDQYNPSHVCSVIDNILTYPPNTIQTINYALEIACQQMEREGTNPSILLKYLYKIGLRPSDSKYRQIRTNNKIFWNNVWITGGRGILHALGFEENGAFVEMGPNVGPLSSDRVKDVSNAIVMLEELQQDMEDPKRKSVYKFNSGMTGRAGWRI